VHCTLCTVHCTLCTLHYALYTVHSTLCTVHCALHSMHCTLCTVHYALYILCTVHYALYTMHSTLCTVHCALYPMHCTHIHHTLYTVSAVAGVCHDISAACVQIGDYGADSALATDPAHQELGNTIRDNVLRSCAVEYKVGSKCTNATLRISMCISANLFSYLRNPTCMLTPSERKCKRHR
jgi:hypothetical protein